MSDRGSNTEPSLARLVCLTELLPLARGRCRREHAACDQLGHHQGEQADAGDESLPRSRRVETSGHLSSGECARRARRRGERFHEYNPRSIRRSGVFSGLWGSLGLVFEIVQGMVDRGADVSWLSQYGHEKEILVTTAHRTRNLQCPRLACPRLIERPAFALRSSQFGPLAGLEVRGMHCEGSTIVVEMRLNANHKALTLEQVVSKRRKMLLDVAAAMRIDIRDDPLWYEYAYEKYALGVGLGVQGVWAGEKELRASIAEALVRSMVNGVACKWFNSDANFSQAVQEALTVKAGLLPTKPPPTGQVCSFGYSEPEILVPVAGSELQIRPYDAGHLAWPQLSLLREVPEEVGHLHLTTLDLSGCRYISRLPESLGGCKSLATIELAGCTGLQEITAALGGCTQLASLSLCNCHLLVSLPAELSNCTAMTSLDLRGCGGRFQTYWESQFGNSDPTWDGVCLPGLSPDPTWRPRLLAWCSARRVLTSPAFAHLPAQA